MKFLFIEAKYDGIIKVPKSVIEKLPQTIGLFFTVQFIDSLESIKKDIAQLMEQTSQLKKTIDEEKRRLSGKEIDKKEDQEVLERVVKEIKEADLEIKDKLIEINLIKEDIKKIEIDIAKKPSQIDNLLIDLRYGALNKKENELIVVIKKLNDRLRNLKQLLSQNSALKRPIPPV